MKYEYKIFSLETNEDKATLSLNGLGNEGWEVISFYQISNAYLRFIAKRSVASDKEFMAGF